jgi:hypothetical protein
MEKFDWKFAGYIVAFGAVGGAVGLVWSLTLGNKPAVDTFPWGIPAYLILGATAAFLGVYMIAKTDLRNVPHAFGFALACGISWAPVLDAGSALVTQVRTQKAKEQVQSQLQETRTAIAALKSSDAQSAPLHAAALKRQIAEVSQSARKIEDRKVLTDYESVLTQATDAATALWDKAPQVATETLAYVNKTRVESGMIQMPEVVLIPDGDHAVAKAEGPPKAYYKFDTFKKDGRS